MDPTPIAPYDTDFSFYLDLILRDHSTYYQAKLMYLLFGPEQDGKCFGLITQLII